MKRSVFWVLIGLTTALTIALGAVSYAYLRAAGYFVQQKTLPVLKNTVETAPPVTQSVHSPELSYSVPGAIMSFEQEDELPLPSMSEPLYMGQRFNLTGRVISSLPLREVTARIAHREHGSVSCYYKDVTVCFSKNSNILDYHLEDADSPMGGESIYSLVDFAALSAGSYSLSILAAADEKEKKELISSDFIVMESEWLKLYSNNFRNNYVEALNFFGGDKDKFLFKYKWAEGRAITTDPEWTEKYITEMKGLGGKSWRVHKEAVPYFKKAIEYVNGTHIRVRTKDGDTGVIKLSALIKSVNGSYVSRFVTDKTFLSHHALGTAIDVNAYLLPNGNEPENKVLIKDEVKKLSYNGIMEENGRKYYDFTYLGDYEESYAGVPETVLNYLLYELAFYRAGFGWGFYYARSSDAMHFTLTERDIAEFSAPDTGLRKIEEYID